MAPDALALALCVALAAALPAEDPRLTEPRLTDPRLTDSQMRGRAIYLRGAGAEGRAITALFGDARSEVPASAVTCAGCHGFDGQGRPEGGVVPSDITWGALTKPYGVRHANGREHPPYDERLLVRAITQGIDPAGNALSTTMPLFQLTHQEAKDLAAYVERLGTLRDPGLGEDVVRLGCVLPAGSADAQRALLTAFFADVGADGGIHGRRVELRFATAEPGGKLEAVRRLVLEEEVFALLATDVAGEEEAIGALLDRTGTPLVGALTDFSLAANPPNRYVFHLLSGVRAQAVALAEHAATLFGERATRVAIVCSPDAAPIADTLAARWDEPVRVTLERDADPSRSDSIARSLALSPVDALFVLVDGDAQLALLRAVADAGVAADAFVPGPLTAPGVTDVAAALQGRLYLSFPRGPGDQDPAALQALVAFARAHELALERSTLTDQIVAWCNARLLVEALRRAGRDVGRERLASTLEAFYRFETGLLPPLTFGPNRRVGALGAYVAPIDPTTGRLGPASPWIALD